MDAVAVFVHEYLVKGREVDLTRLDAHLLGVRNRDLLRAQLGSTDLCKTFQDGVEQLQEVLFRQDLDPVG